MSWRLQWQCRSQDYAREGNQRFDDLLLWVTDPWKYEIRNYHQIWREKKKNSWHVTDLGSNHHPLPNRLLSVYLVCSTNHAPFSNLNEYISLGADSLTVLTYNLNVYVSTVRHVLNLNGQCVLSRVGSLCGADEEDGVHFTGTSSHCFVLQQHTVFKPGHDRARLTLQLEWWKVIKRKRGKSGKRERERKNGL